MDNRIPGDPEKVVMRDGLDIWQCDLRKDLLDESQSLLDAGGQNMQRHNTGSPRMAFAEICI